MLLIEGRQWLTAAEAGERLGGIGPRRVGALIKDGRLPAQRLGRAWIILESDLRLVMERPQGWPAGRPRSEGSGAD